MLTTWTRWRPSASTPAMASRVCGFLPRSCARSTGGVRSEERRVGKECRSRCDWSSDVCSSDLAHDLDTLEAVGIDTGDGVAGLRLLASLLRALDRRGQIGRASCRERV